MIYVRPALVLILLSTLVFGFGFPLGMVGFAGAVFPHEANGSLIMRGGKVVGSSLIGQDFTTAGYFHPRPSATTITDPKDASKQIAAPYEADASAASNLAPTSKALIDRVRGDVKALGGGEVAPDAVTTSASGLDPDISPQNAQSQVARVAAARHLAVGRVADLVAAQTQGRLLGLIGEPRVNVLRLNLALDALSRG
jgi:K+-transporting ATPase ATPase C chain